MCECSDITAALHLFLHSLRFQRIQGTTVRIDLLQSLLCSFSKCNAFPTAEKINLDFGIGGSANASEGEKWNKKIRREKKEALFSAAQFQELYNQILVYNSITCGFPVAFHILLPIWMSVFDSLGPAIYKQYPSFTYFRRHHCAQSGVMDPEAGRCRRTDGRKWRCSKNVVPLQKYCERHMHRGCQGSRKHEQHNHITMSFLASDTGDRSAKNNFTANDENHVEGKSSRKESVSPRLGKLSTILGSKSVQGTKPQRCRRTDGKKWQCRRELSQTAGTVRHTCIEGQRNSCWLLNP